LLPGQRPAPAQARPYNSRLRRCGCAGTFELIRGDVLVTGCFRTVPQENRIVAIRTTADRNRLRAPFHIDHRLNPLTGITSINPEDDGAGRESHKYYSDDQQASLVEPLADWPRQARVA